MKFIENIEIEDSGIKGFVILKDSRTGKILVQKHNMILRTGKEMLLSKLFLGDLVSYISNGSDFKDINAYKDFTLYKAIFFKSESEVSYDDTADNLNLPLEDSDSVDLENRIDIILNPNHISLVNTNDGHIAIKISLRIDFNTTIYGQNMTVLDERIFSSLCLVAKDNSNTTLFSRICFDPIIVTSESILNLDYYIYF